MIPQKEKDNELVHKLIQYQEIPKLSLKPSNIFILKGCVFIDLNFAMESRVSNINYFKQISCSMILKSEGILFRSISINNRYLDSCQAAIFVMKQSNDRDLAELANQLLDYDETLRINDLIKEQMKLITSINQQTQAILAEKRIEFNSFRREKLLSMSKDKYFLFMDFAFDYADMSLKITGDGMNENFIKLIGCDIDTMQTITMRKGVLCLISKKSVWKMLKYIIQQAYQDHSETSQTLLDVQLTTLDDITIDVEVKMETFFCQSAAAFQGYFNPEYATYTYDRKMIICEFNIQEFHLRKINAIRQKYINKQSSLFDQEGCCTPYLFTSNSLECEQQQQEHNFNLLIQLIKSQQNSTQIANYGGQCQQSQPISLVPPKQVQVIQNLIYDIPYEVQSQEFIERFYGNQTEISTQSASLQKESCTNQCGYRLK